ncbi:MAG TPA: GAF domain-containing protein [Longimicrobiaceae bacterium]|nr:GAF domain-containing protein [Longimicrobiaceae bacterium]
MKRSPSIAGPAGGADPPGAVRDRLDRCQAELVRVRRSLEAAEAAAGRLAAEHAVLDERCTVLTRLFVAASALQEAGDEPSALRALGEVMVNLAGAREFGVFEGEEGAELELVHSAGIDAQSHARLRPAGEAARALETGESWRADSPHPGFPGGEPVACIPLRVGASVTGVIVVWSFLPQKLAFGAFDLELFALLVNRAGPALRAARLLEACT